MNPTRSILAVLGGFVLFQVISQMLETTLVSVVSDEPITDEAGFFAVRNQPVVLAAKIGYTSVAALLAGYMAAKIAGTDQVRHAMAAAALVTALLVWEFTASDYAAFTPLWMRVVLAVLVGPVMLAGGWIRASAARAPAPPASSHPVGGTRP